MKAPNFRFSRRFYRRLKVICPDAKFRREVKATYRYYRNIKLPTVTGMNRLTYAAIDTETNKYALENG